MELLIPTKFADPAFGPHVSLKHPKVVRWPWVSTGLVNNTGKGNRAWYPDLDDYILAVSRGFNVYPEVMLDCEFLPMEPGHDSPKPTSRGGHPSLKRWLNAHESGIGRDGVYYHWTFLKKILVAVQGLGADICVYGCLPAWFDMPNVSWQNETEFLAHEALFLANYVQTLCLDVYIVDNVATNNIVTNDPDRVNFELWQIDFDQELRRTIHLQNKNKIPLIYFQWSFGPRAGTYVGDKLALAMLQECAKRGFKKVGIFEPPVESYDVLVEGTKL